MTRSVNERSLMRSIPERRQEIPVIRTTEQQDLIADLSHYNGVIDWSSASQILDFVILRASVGSKADTQYVNYAQNCNIPFGAYHFVKAGTAEDAVKEAASAVLPWSNVEAGVARALERLVLGRA